MTTELVDEIQALISKVDEMGGAVAGVEAGFQKSEIEKNSYRIAQEIEGKTRVIVGVNEYISPAEPYKPLRVDESVAHEQSAKLATLRKNRDRDRVDNSLKAVVATAGICFRHSKRLYLQMQQWARFQMRYEALGGVTARQRVGNYLISQMVAPLAILLPTAITNPWIRPDL
jgi:methylmalonyl-CoA mutase N-terminal domain/subunit